MAQVPVISFSFAGLEKHPGFQLTLPMLHGLLYAVLYGDLMMALKPIRCEPYENRRRRRGGAGGSLDGTSGRRS